MQSYRHSDVPQLVKLRLALQGKRPLPPGGEVEGSRRQVFADRNPPYVARPGEALFGDIKLVQSQYKTQRNWIEVRE
jgi:hypothetical protein